MNDNIKNMFISKAIEIGDSILKESITSESGIYWETTSFDIYSNPVKRPHIDLYTGVSGISLYLLELYKITKDIKYLHIVDKSIDWLTDTLKLHPGNWNTFLTGNLGIAYLSIELFLETNNDKYYKIYKKIIDNCIFDFDNLKNEYISGISGIVVCLLYLHSKTQDNTLLEKINLLVGKLLVNINLDKKGFFWDKDPESIKSLCGFSHGVSGISYTFLVLSQYFNNNTFKEIASKGIEYENQFYNSKERNWFDLRKGIYTKDDLLNQKKKYLSKDYDFFNKGEDACLWCHGAAGILINRLKASSVLDELSYNDQINNAISKIINTDFELEGLPSSFTLCHGRGGNADIILSAHKLLNKQSYADFAFHVGEEIVRFHNNFHFFIPGLKNLIGREEDLSLFNGNAGIGHFLLRLYDPENVKSILAPLLENNYLCKTNEYKNFDFLNIEHDSLKKTIYKKYFSKTYTYYLSGNKKDLKKIRTINNITVENMKLYMKSIFDYSNGIHFEILNNLYQIELESLKLNMKVKSYCYYNIQDIINIEAANNILKLGDEIFDIVFAKSEYTKVMNNKYWIASDDVTEISKVSALLIQYKINGPLYTVLDSFPELILKHFNTNNTLSKIYKLLIEYYDISGKEELIILKQKLIEQVKIMLKNRVLIVVDTIKYID